VVESDFVDDQSGNIEIEDEIIVYSSENEEVTEDTLGEIIPDNDEPIVFEDNIDLPEEDTLDGQISYEGDEEIPTASETQSEEDLSKKFEESTTSFKIIDEVEDASERGYNNPDDMTGYYGHVDAPVSQVKPEPPKVETPVVEPPTVSSYADSKVEEKPAPKISTFDERVSAVSKKVDGEKSQIDMDTFMKASAEKKTAETKPKKVKKVKYVRPPVDLLTTESETPHQNEEEMSAKIALLEESLEALGVPAKVDSVTISPDITRYELSMPTGVSVNRIENLSKDIGYYLASNGAIRIESPIPGKRAVGVEVPNDHIYTVSLTEIIKSKEFREAKSSLSFALGKDLNGKIRVESLEKMPHLLVAGATKSGKSSGLNSMLISLMYKSSPSEVKFILIDPKLVEFTAYNGIPHLMTPQAITDVNEAINAFKWTEKEMDRRYLILQKSAVRDIQEYNQRQEILDGLEPKMPYIVVIVDEFASLMLSTKEHAKELDEIIMNIAGKARAAGIHLVLATQRPSVNVITGTVKANLNSRIAFAVASSQDSRIILDNNGAESLLGRGDMLFAPVDSPVEIRVQGAYVDNSEVKRVVQFVKENNPSEYDEEFIAALKVKSGGGGGVDGVEPIEHNLLKDVCRCLIKSGSASGSLITRRFSVGWNKAAKIIEYVESLGFVGPQVGAKGRELIITKEKFEEYFGEPFDNN
ncbi:MAG: hypothetical protein IJY70_04760, partial [Clostridia bacterium]|nr:hypothetical protein [Clostridia bacterium]